MIATAIADLLSTSSTLWRVPAGRHRAADRPVPRSLDLGPRPDPADAGGRGYRAGCDRLRPRRAARGERGGARRHRAPVGPRRAADDRHVGPPAARRPVRGAGRARTATARSPSSSPTASATSSGGRSARCRASTACSALMLHDPDPVRLADMRAHPRFGWWPAAHPELTDFLGMPIMHGDEILGALFLANKQTPGGFTADDEELLRLLAAHAAIALINARLYERSRELSIVEERNRIARELHDAVTQKLFSLRLTADAAATLRRPATRRGRRPSWTRYAGSPPRRPRSCGRSWSACARSTWPATAWTWRCASRSTCSTGCTQPAVRFAGEPVPRLPAAREEAAYRIAQEALHNALRHADAEPRSTVAVRRRRRIAGAGGHRRRARVRPAGAGRASSGWRRCASGPVPRAAGSTCVSRPGARHDRTPGGAGRWLSRSGSSWSTTIRSSGRACARSSTCRTT